MTTLLGPGHTLSDHKRIDNCLYYRLTSKIRQIYLSQKVTDSGIKLSYGERIILRYNGN